MTHALRVSPHAKWWAHVSELFIPEDCGPSSGFSEALQHLQTGCLWIRICALFLFFDSSHWCSSAISSSIIAKSWHPQLRVRGILPRIRNQRRLMATQKLRKGKK